MKEKLSSEVLYEYLNFYLIRVSTIDRILINELSLTMQILTLIYSETMIKLDLILKGLL